VRCGAAGVLVGTLGGDVLRPSVVMAILDGILERMSPLTRARDVDELRTELASVEREVARLTNALRPAGSSRRSWRR
jgi:hypothetical protein